MACTDDNTISMFAVLVIVAMISLVHASLPLSLSLSQLPSPSGRSVLTPYDEALIECANGADWCRSILASQPPPSFDVLFKTTVGSFTVHVNTSWCPPQAQRFWVLADLHYFQRAAFYRVLNLDTGKGGDKFVTQMGYRGVPEVDAAWNTKLLSNVTWSVASRGNVRGTVAFGTGFVENDGKNPNCTAKQCSQGFSVELYVNLADNSKTGKVNLDAMDFAIFGYVDESEMPIVEKVYSGYGEMADLCDTTPSYEYCLKDSATGKWKGINFNEYMAQGNALVQKSFPLMDYVLDAYRP